MGFFSFIQDKLGIKSLDSSDPGSFPANALYDTPSPSGQVVNKWTALKQSVVLQCVTVISNGISQIPFQLLRETDGEGRQPAKDHPLYWLLKEGPNPWQSSIDFWNMVSIHLALEGEIAIWKIKVRGQIKQLIPFSPTNYRIDTKYVGGWAQNTYIFTKDDGSTVAVPEEDVWHLRWREFELRAGLPQLSVARNVVGTALAGDNKSGYSMKNRSTISGVVHPKMSMKPEQRDEFWKSWTKTNQAAEASGGSIFANADIEFTPVNTSNADQQFLEQRKLQIEEVCRCWNVNPMLVFSYDNNSSYNNSEQMMLQHVVHTMSPWYRLIEESAFVNLLTEDERRNKGLYFAFNDNALLRADSKARSEYYRALFNVGAITPNEIRAKEDMPPMEGGDKLYVQGATVPLEDAGKDQSTTTTKPTEGANPSSVPDGTQSSEDNNA